MPTFLDELNKKFIYKKDREQYSHRDAWHIMKREPYYGDCEDYALTLLYNLKDRSILKFLFSLIIRESKIIYCKSPRGIGHVILKYKGRYIDNIQKEWTTRGALKADGYKLSAWLYIPYQVVIKLIFGLFKTR
tara:strand:- start:49 stop:447 length:399 start_codon:yes stop_codon:yes gene_type:complete